MSNLSTLPAGVSDYAKLYHEKRKLNSRVAELNRELREIEGKLIEKMTADDLDAYEILPSSRETRKFGSVGALQLKIRNEYDRVSKDNLIRFCIQFFRYLIPETTEQDITRLGYGQAEWIWANRGRTAKKWLDRIYLEDEEARRHRQAQKRKKTESDAETVEKPKKTRVRAPQNIPRSREDFMMIPGFQGLVSSVSQS